MIEVKQFDILTFKGDAIVNPANVSLFGGGGLDGAIHRAAGTTEVLDYMSRYRDFSMYGGAYPCPGYKLPCKWIIHAVGIPYYEPQCESVYRDLYKNIALTCNILDIKDIAIPAIGMGIFGIPIDVGAQWMADGMKHFKGIDVTITTYDEHFDKAIRSAL